MKIAVFLGTFPTVSETFIINQIVSLIDSGHDVCLFSNEKGNSNSLHNNILKYDLLGKVSYKIKQPVSKMNKVKSLINWLMCNFVVVDWVLFFRTLNFFKFGRKAFSLGLFFEAQWFLTKKKYDVIHVHFGDNAIAIADLKSKGFIPNSKFVVSFHGYDINPYYIEKYKVIYLQLFNQVDVITVNNNYSKKLVFKINSNFKNVYNLPVGLDTNFFTKTISEKNSKNFIILFCGRLISLKGPDIAIEIVKELKNRGFDSVRLEIVGDGEMREELNAKIKDYQLECSIKMHGFQTQESVKEIMNNSNLLIMPGIYDLKFKRGETQGLVIQEAQSMELPVVVSDVGGMKYGLINKITGFVIRENDILNFVNHIEYLIKSPELCSKMGAEGRKYVVENYDSQVLLRQLINLYN